MASITNEEFLRRCRDAHGDTYDYTKTVYTKMHSKVIITCRKHGDFEQRAQSHILGKGCWECSYETRNLHKRLSAEDVIRRFREVHGDKYDYTFVRYTGTKTDVQIDCPIHGAFWQTPNNHMAGVECPACSLLKRSSLSLNSPATLYYVRVDCPAGTFYKIGVTARSLKERWRGHLRGDMCLKIKVLWEEKHENAGDALRWEKSILLQGYQNKTELLKDELGGWSEVFTEDILGMDK